MEIKDPHSIWAKKLQSACIRARDYIRRRKKLEKFLNEIIEANKKVN